MDVYEVVVGDKVWIRHTNPEVALQSAAALEHCGHKAEARRYGRTYDCPLRVEHEYTSHNGAAVTVRTVVLPPDERMETEVQDYYDPEHAEQHVSVSGSDPFQVRELSRQAYKKFKEISDAPQ